MLRGTCDPARLLDLVENFTLFVEEQRGHDQADRQEPPVSRRQQRDRGGADAGHAARSPTERRLGVFWHTQGSGKSYSMIFFAQKVLRKLPGNWTFLVVTDRQELDQQIYRTSPTRAR